MSRNMELAFVEFAKRRQLDVVLVAAGVLLGVVLNWGTVETMLFAVFIWSILRPISSRALAVPALALLVLVPILLAIGHDSKAEEFSVYAYYFLVMAVIRGIIELREEKEEK